MPKFTVEKSIFINTSVEKAYEVVRDFGRWPLWSPWLIAEPDASVVVAEDGMSYQWEGAVVGSGKMEIISDEMNKRIEYRLTVLAPMKSVCDVYFAFEAIDGGVKVTWHMLGSLPFFLFWMTKMMSVWIGMDYERGLKMLKDYIEIGSVPSKLEFERRRRIEGFKYLGIRTSCPMAEIGPHMERDMERLCSMMKSKRISVSGPPFAIYHKWQMVKGIAEYTTGLPMESIPSDLPSEFETGELPTCNVFAVTHTGPYRHIGNAWSAGVMYARNRKIKQSKKAHPFELYLNDPAETPENALKATICFPLR